MKGIKYLLFIHRLPLGKVVSEHTQVLAEQTAPDVAHSDVFVHPVLFKAISGVIYSKTSMARTCLVP